MQERIVIVGLGPGSREDLSLGGWELLRKAENLFLRTDKHPVVVWLKSEGIKFNTFDRYYEEARDFGRVYLQIAETICHLAESGQVAYAVPGHPLVAEESVRLILLEAQSRGWAVKIVPAPSFLDALFVALRIDPTVGIKVIDAVKAHLGGADTKAGLIVAQVYSRLVASDLKLELLEHYPPEHQVQVVRAAGVENEESITTIPLYSIDRMEYDHLSSIYVPPVEKRFSSSLDPLLHILSSLRGEHGCPWDKEQTHQSLTRYLLEETYEVVEAIGEKKAYKLCEELGDLLLQVAFHAQIAFENGEFDINDVIDGICQKMIRRHPHVFGQEKIENTDQVLSRWEQIKKAEKNDRRSVLDGIAKGAPALFRAERVQAKTARYGFDWPDYRGAMDKVHEELEEVIQAIRAENQERVSQEIGDLLFSCVNLARLLNINAEETLTHTTNKFITRFKYIEKKAETYGKNINEFTLVELNRWWDEAKNKEKN